MPFLTETLVMLKNQSYQNIEVIVIDDGSSDGSLEYLKSLNWQNLIVKPNEGKGACAARNFGIKLAKGDYIQFLDADDLLKENKLELQVEALTNNKDSIAVCSTMHFFDSIDNGKITDEKFLYSTENPKEFLLNLYGADGVSHNMIQTSAWLTPKSLINKVGLWDEQLSKDQDGEYFCRVVARANKVMYTSNTLNYYRKHINGSNIGNQRKRIHLESQLKALHSKAQQFNGLENSKAYKNAMALQYKIIAIEAFPEHKDLSKKALHFCSTFGNSNYLPVLGGKIIEFIKYTLGWRAAKSVSYWVHKK